jgi:hypothetical protein
MSQSKTHWKKLQNPDYFGAWSIPEGKDIVLTINFVKTEEVVGVGGRKEHLPVLHFKDKGVKPLILNVTNSRTIEGVHGSPYIEDWTGKQIQLYQDVTTFGKEEVECVRIRASIPNAKNPEFTPQSNRWNGAVVAIASGDSTIEAIKKHYTLSDKNESILKQQVLEQLNKMEETVND